jgi:hypothetical protein
LALTKQPFRRVPKGAAAAKNRACVFSSPS